MSRYVFPALVSGLKVVPLVKEITLLVLPVTMLPAVPLTFL
jgi:hypothetical protein